MPKVKPPTPKATPKATPKPAAKPAGAPSSTPKTSLSDRLKNLFTGKKAEEIKQKIIKDNEPFYIKNNIYKNFARR